MYENQPKVQYDARPFDVIHIPGVVNAAQVVSTWPNGIMWLRVKGSLNMEVSLVPETYKDLLKKGAVYLSRFTPPRPE